MPTAPDRAAVAFHESIARDWEAKYSRRSFRSRESILDEQLGALDLSGKRWLDAGCGTGRLARMLAERGAYVHGIDASDAMVRVARDIAGEQGLGDKLTFELIGDLEEYRFRQAAYDGVLCMSVLEYLKSPVEVLKSLGQTIRPGGVIILAVPNRLSVVRMILKASFALSRRLLSEGWPRYMGMSRHEFYRSTLCRALVGIGFEVVTVKYFGGPLPRSVQQFGCGGSLMLCVARKRS